MTGRWAGWLGGAAAFGAMVLACGSGPDFKRGGHAPPQVAPPAEDWPGAYLVPPDRARVAVSLEVEVRGTHGEAAAALRQQIDDLGAALPEGCALSTSDYLSPRSADDGFVARAELVVDISLAGLAEVRERMDRLDACLGPLAALPAGPIDERSERRISTSSLVLMVDRPSAHFGALAARLVEEQRAAASLVAPQLHPEDRRCVPTGRVTPARRSLEGVELVLDVSCRTP